MKTIGIYDSGCGGFSILNQIIKFGFSGTIYYYADTINNPWGPKTKLELRIILSTIADWFKEHKVDNIISGCNTTFSMFKEDLNPIFGSQVKNIFHETKKNYTFDSYSALCTENSFKSDLFSTLFPDKKIEEIACPNLANFIELNKIDEAIKLASSFIEKAHHKNIILGCTHYALIKQELIKKYPDINFVDPAEYYVSADKSIQNNHSIYLKVTGNKNQFINNINKYLNSTNFIVEKSDSKNFIHQQNSD